MTPNSSLLQWLTTFELDVELKDEAYYNLADGYVCARILNQISPVYFSDKWLNGIKPVPPNGSWRLRVSNLNRILQKVHDYASDLQSSQFKPSAIKPDVAVIAQNFDPDQVSRLIQLILFCAITCDRNQEYVERIHHLPRQVQQDIKEAIEELIIKSDSGDNIQEFNASHASTESVSRDNKADNAANSSQKVITSSPISSKTPTRSIGFRSSSRRDSQIYGDNSRRNESTLDMSTHSNHDSTNETIDDLRNRLNAAMIIKDEKSQACHELELKLRQLQLEKDQLAIENERLASEKNLAKNISSPVNLVSSRRQSHSGPNIDNRLTENRPNNMEDDNSHGLILQQNKKLQAELQRLKEEIIKIETEKEDFRLKSNLLKQDLEKMTLKRDELRNKAEQAKRLQDELDEHRHISEKVVSYETMVENLLKKNNDLKKERKSIEEKNISHIREIVELKEENNQLTSALSRIDIYKKQLHEAQVALSEETNRADKAEFELVRMSEKYSAARNENEKLYETTNQLMRSGSGILQQGSKSGKEFAVAVESDAQTVRHLDNRADNGNLSMVEFNVDLKERIARLEYENKLLQDKLNVKNANQHAVLGGMLENANARCTKLELENRNARKMIIQLESRLKDITDGQHGPSATNNIADSSSDNMLALMNRVEELQRMLFQKEQEHIEADAKYKRNLQKAKDVIKTLNSNPSLNASLHPSCMSSASPFNSSSLDENNLLKQQLKEREERLIDMEREFYEYKKVKEMHERLILSAFYGLTTPMQWKNAEKRLERTTLTSPPNTASSSINHSKHSH